MNAHCAPSSAQRALSICSHSYTRSGKHIKLYLIFVGTSICPYNSPWHLFVHIFFSSSLLFSPSLPIYSDSIWKTETFIKILYYFFLVFILRMALDSCTYINVQQYVCMYWCTYVFIWCMRHSGMNASEQLAFSFSFVLFSFLFQFGFFLLRTFCWCFSLALCIIH